MNAPVPAHEAERLRVLQSYGILDTPPEERFDRITRLAARICGVPIALVSLVDEHRQWFKSRVGIDSSETPRSISFCTHAITGEDVMEVPDALHDPRFRENPLVVDKPGVRFYAGAPLMVQGGHAIGTLCVLDYEPRALSADQRGMLRDLASLVTDEMERTNRAALVLEEAEQKRRAESRFRSLIQNGADLIMLVDAQGLYIYVSPSSLNALGYEPEELLGRSGLELLHPDDAELVRQRFHALAGDEPGAIESFRMRNRNGKWRWFEASMSNQLDNPELRAVIINARDITERREREEALAKQSAALARSERRFRSFVIASAQTMWVADETGTFSGLSSMWRDFTGQASPGSDVDEARWHWLGALHPEDQPRISAEWKDHLERQEVYECEYRLRRHDGVYRWFAERAVPVFDDNGHFVEWVGTCTDIDDRKRAEEALLESQDRLRVALDAGEIGTWRTNFRAGVNYRDAATNRLLGFPEDQAYYGTFDYFQNVHPEDRAATQAAFRHAIEETGVYFTENRILRPNGEVRWVRDRGRVIFDADGQPLYATGAIADITEQVETEQELIRAKEQAEEMARLKDVFLANMSHEIRTPLTSILGYAEILAEEIITSGEGKEFVDVIRMNGARLLDTLNSVLDLAQLESGSLKLKPVSVDVMAELQSVLMQFEGTARSKGIALRAEADSFDITLTADRAVFGRVLTNLVSNAIKFTDEGSVSLTVRKTDESVVIQVVDTGIGIGPEFLPHVFEDFQQESSGVSRSHEGNGLGLTITKRLLDLMGGEISVESERGRGTVFTVTLRNSIAAPAEERPVPDAGLTLLPKRRVLAVEDNEQTRKLLHLALSSRFNVDSVADFRAAVERAGSQAYDAFLLDVDLGEERSGIDVLRALKSLPGYQQVPCIACTAYALPGDEHRFLSEGFDAYISKPFRRAKLLQLIDSVLTRKNAAAPAP